MKVFLSVDNQKYINLLSKRNFSEPGGDEDNTYYNILC